MQFLNKSCSRYNSLKNGELVDMEEVNSLTQRVYFAARLHCCRGRRAYCTQVSLGNMPHTCVRCRKCVFWKCALIHFVGRWHKPLACDRNRDCGFQPQSIEHQTAMPKKSTETESSKSKSHEVAGAIVHSGPTKKGLTSLLRWAHKKNAEQNSPCV